jgi:lipoate---protein ligase
MTEVCEVAREEQTWNEQRLAQRLLEPAWRLWQYRQPSIVLGCSQHALLTDARRSASVPVLVRSSGGGAVLTGPWMLGLSALLPPQHGLLADSLTASYRWLGELLAGALQLHGIAALAVAPARARAPDDLSWACFAAVASWEVAVGQRKIAGLAQRRRRNGVLLSAGLLLDAPDWPLLCVALGRPADEAEQLARRTTSVCAQTGESAAGARIVSTLANALDRALMAAR